MLPMSISRVLGPHSFSSAVGYFVVYTQQGGILTEECVIETPVPSPEDIQTLMTIAFSVAATYRE